MKNTQKYIALGIMLAVGMLAGRYLFPTTNEPILSTTHEHSEGTTFTCSMHPHIQQNNPGKCPLCGMDLVAIQNTGIEDNINSIELSKTAQELSNINTVKVVYESPSIKLNLNGRVLPDGQKIAVQTSHIEGRIEQLLIGYIGQQVKAGEVIAYVYSPELIEAQNELLEAYHGRISQPDLYAASLDKLKNWKVTQAQIDEILSSNAPIENFPIQSDWTGIVLKKNLNKGSHVSKGTEIVEIANLSSVWITFDIYEKDINLVKVGDQLTMEFSTFPGELFKGQINFIDPVIDPETRIAQIRIIYTNTFKTVYPQTFAVANLTVQPYGNQKKLIIPKSAVLWTGERSVVYIKTQTAQFMLREVTLGIATAAGYEIKEGLTEGEEIVTNGAFTLDAASQLSGKKSMMN